MIETTDKLNEIYHSDGCPKCGSQNVKKVAYTWWGGVIGPRMLHHTKCNDCKYLYNAKTRKSNTTGIVIYSVILFALAFALIYFSRKA